MTHEYKTKLTAEREALLTELSSLGVRGPNGEWEATANGTDTSVADANTNADRFEDFEEKSALINPLEARLTEIENALKRIEEGTYGTCRVCNASIEEARLQANPSAETCMAHLEN